MLIIVMTHKFDNDVKLLYIAPSKPHIYGVLWVMLILEEITICSL